MEIIIITVSLSKIVKCGRQCRQQETEGCGVAEVEMEPLFLVDILPELLDPLEVL